MSLIIVTTKKNRSKKVKEVIEICPEDYCDKSSFLEACREEFSDEKNPVFFFETYHDVPYQLISNNDVCHSLWDWLPLSSDEKTIIQAYWDSIDENGYMTSILDRYLGEHDSEGDWAFEYLESTGVLDRTPEEIRHHIDFDSYVQSAKAGGLVVFAKSGQRTLAFASN